MKVRRNTISLILLFVIATVLYILVQDYRIRVITVLVTIFITIIFLIIGIKFYLEKIYVLRKAIIEINNHIVQVGKQIEQNRFCSLLIIPHIDMESEKDFFHLEFKKRYPHFITHLRMLVPRVTEKEELFCMMIKLNMTNTEIAQNLNVDTKSVLTFRSRFRRKLRLKKNEGLDKWIRTIE